MKNIFRVLVLLCVVVLAACSSNKHSYDYRTDYDFTKLGSYYVLPVDPSIYKNPKVSELEVNRITALLKKELSKRYTESSKENADFHVRYFLVLEERMKMETYNASFGMYRGGYGYHYGVHSPQVKNTYYQQGSIIIDIIDTDDNEVVWRGSTQGRVKENSTPQKRDERVSNYLMRLFSNFPPQ